MNTPVCFLAGDFPLLDELPPQVRLIPGDHNADVKALQRALRSAGYALEIDGYFGRITLACARSCLAEAQRKRDCCDAVDASTTLPNAAD